MKSKNKKTDDNQLPCAEELKPQANKNLNSQEEQELEKFCNAFEIDEIELAEWVETHETLCLRLPVFATQEEATQGLKKQIRFSRKIRKLSECKSKILTEVTKVTMTIEIPENAEHGDQILLRGLGEVNLEKKGDLAVTIYIKK